MRHILALVLLSLLCSCLSQTVRVYGGYMNLRADGDAGLANAANTNNVNGIRGELEDDFALGESETPFLRLDLEIDDWDIELSGFQYKDSSRSTLSARYGDIPSGTAVEGDLRVSNVKLGFLTDIVSFGPVELAAGLAINYFDVDMDVASLTPQVAPNTVFEESNFEAPVPMLYVRSVVDVWVLRGEVSVAWIEADISDVEGSFLDVDAMLVFSPTPILDVFAGYRYIDIDVDGRLDGQDFTTHTQLSGWYLGAGFTF